MSKKPIKQSLLRICAALALATTALAFQAPVGLAEATPRAGAEFVRLPHPVAQAPQQQVVEVFWYGCVHSYELETPLDDWAARQSPPVQVIRIPAAWSNTPVMLAYARLYYTLDRLGQAQQLAIPAFHAVLDEHRALTTEDAATEWASEQGVDPDAFRAAYESPEVVQETAAAPALRESYGVHEMPSVVVGGRYRTSPFLADGGVTGTVPVVDYLYQRARSAAPASPGRTEAGPTLRPVAEPALPPASQTGN